MGFTVEGMQGRMMQLEVCYHLRYVKVKWAVL